MREYASVAGSEVAIYEASLSFLHSFVVLSRSLFACRSGWGTFDSTFGRFINTGAPHQGSFAIRFCPCCCIPELFDRHTIYADWSFNSTPSLCYNQHALNHESLRRMRLASACRLGIGSGLFRCEWAWLFVRLWRLASEGRLTDWKWFAASSADSWLFGFKLFAKVRPLLSSIESEPHSLHQPTCWESCVYL